MWRQTRVCGWRAAVLPEGKLEVHRDADIRGGPDGASSRPSPTIPTM
ncbi:MAG TPA: hypothetical protein VE908_15065 [Mycobacterium sp.]|nr:hypothetical protein [Mycobacterium sp.]